MFFTIVQFFKESKADLLMSRKSSQGVAETAPGLYRTNGCLPKTSSLLGNLTSSNTLWVDRVLNLTLFTLYVCLVAGVDTSLS